MHFSVNIVLKWKDEKEPLQAVGLEFETAGHVRKSQAPTNKCEFSREYVSFSLTFPRSGSGAHSWHGFLFLLRSTVVILCYIIFSSHRLFWQNELRLHASISMWFLVAPSKVIFLHDRQQIGFTSLHFVVFLIPTCLPDLKPSRYF